MSAITTFLSLAVPWREGGYIGIHGPYTTSDGRPIMPGQAFTDLAAAVRYVNASRQYRDLYVCMSLQAQAEPYLNRHNKRKLRAKRHREQALWLQGWWIDVDIKHGFFRDTNHALGVFGDWCRAIGMPPPTLIVLTGSGGFHAHWCLNTPVSRETWQPLADALAIAAGSLKPLPGPDGEERRLDIGLTTNPACLLRIPDTLNFKHDPPQPAQLAHVGETYALETIDAALTPYKGTYTPVRPAKATLQASPLFAGMATPPSLTAGLEDKWRPAAEEVADVCPWLARVLHTRGAGCAEPEWFMSLQVGFFCQQGDELAHDLSDAHATYTEEETDRKFAQIEETHCSGKLGWPRCKTIHLNGAPECRSCEHLPKEKSPLNFVTTAPAEPIVLPPEVSRTGKDIVLQPTGFTQDAEGLVWKLGEEDKPPQLVCDYPIWNLATDAPRNDGSGKYLVSFDTYIDAERFKCIVVPYDFLSDPRQFGHCLSSQGMVPRDRQRVLLRDYMQAFVSLLRSMKTTSKNSEPYGWAIDDKTGNLTGFVLGDRHYNCAGVRRVAPLDLKISQNYRPMGSIEVFKKNAKLITQQGRYDLITIIAAAFGGPLIKLTGVNGAVVHVYSSQGGLGKSHAMRIGQSVWSNPALEQAQLDDTANYLIGKLGVLRNIPLFYDEVKGKLVTEEMVKLVFTITQGRTKGRMAATSDLKEVFGFCTMLVIASNNSLVDYINEQTKTTTAGLDRVYEIPVQPNANGVGLIDRTEAQQAMGELTSNYGHAGVLYAEYLGKNIEAVQKAVRDAQRELNNMVNGNDAERYWIATMAACYIGAHIAHKLDLIEIDERKLLQFLLDNFYRLRSVVRSSPADLSKPESIERILRHYITDNARYVLVTETVPNGKGRPMAPKIIAGLDYRDGVRVRIATKDKLLRIPKTHFSSWLKNGPLKMGPTEVIGAIATQLPTKFPRVSLASGTTLENVPREELIEVSNWVHKEEQL